MDNEQLTIGMFYKLKKQRAAAPLPSGEGQGWGLDSAMPLAKQELIRCLFFAVPSSLPLLRCPFFAAPSSLIKYFRFNFRKFWS
jgi:hypothetical protein